MKNLFSALYCPKRLLWLLIVIAWILTSPTAYAQTGIDVCSVTWVDSTNSVYENLCIFGNASELYAYNEVVSENSGYVPVVDSRSVLTDNNNPNFYQDTGFYNAGVYPQWGANTDVESGFQISPGINDTYTLSGYYAECYDSTGQGGLGDPLSDGLACIWEEPSNYASLTDGISGYINPRYIVLGISYIPPGPQSYVKYCDNTTVSSTNSIINTLLSSYTSKYEVAESQQTIGGWYSGIKTFNNSTTNTQSSKTSDSVTVSTSASYCTQWPGATNAYQPNNHDYDVIWVWLNPVALITFPLNSSGTTITGVQWTGYGYNSQDQPAMDLYPAYVGCLNGRLSGCDLTPLSRAWDTHTNWPAGQGPALTSADIANILAMDPFSQCSQNWPPPAECQVTPDPHRFTVTPNPNIYYQQPPVGGEPYTTTAGLGYTIINSQGRAYTTANSTTYGIDQTLKLSGFGDALTVTTGTSQTFATTTEADQSLTTTDEDTAVASITGPPCVDVGGVCNPLYPSPAYPGPTEFDVYEDNQFGTFLLYPANWEP